MRIIVIGNGSTILEKENGNKIDSFDYVVRMGVCKIKGYEKYTGTKTDMFRLTWKQHFEIKKYQDDNSKITFNDTELNNFKDILFTNINDYDNFTEHDRFIANRKHKTRFVTSYHIKKHNKTRLLHDRCLQYFLTLHPHVKNIFYCDIKTHIHAIRQTCKSDHVIIPTNGILTLNYIINAYPQEEIYITGYDGSMTRHYFKNNDTCSTTHNNINEHIYLKLLTKTGKVKILE
jgi:hypothetical protein